MKTRVDFGNEMDRYRNVKPQEHRKGQQQTLKDNAEKYREELAATKNRSHKNNRQFYTPDSTALCTFDGKPNEASENVHCYAIFRAVW